MQQSNNIANLINYLKGKLSKEERYSVEKQMNNDPFLSDAMDGFAKHTADGIESDLAELQSKLEKRSSEPKTFILKPIFRVAASVVLLVSIGAILYILSKPNLPFEEIAEFKIEEETNEIAENESKLETITAIEETTPTIVTTEKNNISSEPAIAPINKSMVVNSELQAEPEIVSSNEQIAYTSNENNKSEKTQIARQKESEIREDNTTIAGIMELQSEEAEEGLVTVSGKAIDMETFEVLPGVTVMAQATSKGVITDIDGNFSIQTTPNDTITITSIGYLAENISVDKLIDQDEPVALKQDEAQMDEVVVVGYGAAKKSARAESGRSRKLENTIQNEITTPPQPAIGFDAFHAYILKNKQINLNNSVSIELHFSVNNKGRISAIEVPDANTDATHKKEAIRLLKEGPEWNPAFEAGIPTEQITSIIIEL